MALSNGAQDRGAKKSTRKPNFGTFGPIIIIIIIIIIYIFYPRILNLRLKSKRFQGRSEKKQIWTSRQQILIFISWTTKNSNKCQWSFYPAIHSRSQRYALKPAQKVSIFTRFAMGFGRVATPSEKKRRNFLLFRPNQDTPLVGHDVWNIATYPRSHIAT